MENMICMCKNPQSQSIEIFSLMLSGIINLSAKARKYIFYMYLLLFGSCTREMIPLLLSIADRSTNCSGCYEKDYMDAKMIDNFISNRLKSKHILRITIKNRILYQLTPSGYKELSKFLCRQNMTEGIDSSYLKWCESDAYGMIRRNSVHSSVVGIIFIQMASRCTFTVSDFKLDTPLDQHGNIRKGSYDQSFNKFRSDAYLLLSQPCRQEFFFENDMGTERADAVTAKLERYFALIFSAEREIYSSCIHFTIGDYRINKKFPDFKIPSKYTLQVYRAYISVLFAAAGLKENVPVKPEQAIELINKVNTGTDTFQCGILAEIKKYVSEINSIDPNITNVYSCFNKTQVLKAVSHDRQKDFSLYHMNPDMSFLKRREKIFEWCRNAPDISLLVRRGLRITSSDNCSNGMDFIFSYPNLMYGGIEAYKGLMKRHIQEFSYRGKYTDIQDNGLINTQIIQDSLERYNNIAFFQADNTYYAFANCYSLHHNKGSFRYSYENISNDLSARMRIERYLDNGAPVIPFLQLFIVYSDDIYSLKYVESLKANYSFLENRQSDIHLERI